MLKLSWKIIAILLISLLFLLPVIYADDDPGSSFENARDQLLSSCNSEIVSHSAIILALIIGMATVGKDAIRAISDKKLWKHVFGFGSIAFAVLLTLYESGRLFYYSDVSQRLLTLNNDTLATWLNVTSIPRANETYYTAFINRYSTSFTPQGATSQFAQLISPNNHPLLIPFLVLIGFSSIALSFVIIARAHPRFPTLLTIWTVLILMSYFVYQMMPQPILILTVFWSVAILISIITVIAIRHIIKGELQQFWSYLHKHWHYLRKPAEQSTEKSCANKEGCQKVESVGLFAD